MTRRLLAVAFAAVLVFLMLGSPAAAKGPDRATLTGPGIGTMRVTWTQPNRTTLTALLDVTRFWDGAGVAAWDIAPPVGDLGPKFTVTYHIPHSERQVRQELYPYAEEGPVVYMAPDQAMYGMAMPYGWLAVDKRLARVFNHIGASPDVQPVLQPAAQELSTWGKTATSSDDSSSSLLVAVGAAGTILLAAAVVRGRLRIRSRPA